MEDNETLGRFLLRLKKKPRINALKGKSPGAGGNTGVNFEIVSDTRGRTRRARKPKWNSLIHSGVMFPPSYLPHGIKMLYDGKQVVLTPEQEEIATLYAEMLETEHVKNPVFNANFFEDWTQSLGMGHVIKSLGQCDFSLINKWVQDEKKKTRCCPEAEEEADEDYRWALVDGSQLEVTGYKIRPPGLFRGRGDHPKMGKLKRHILPNDVTINISNGFEMYLKEPADRWKEVCQNREVTWLARWKEPLFPGQFKYMQFSDSSSLKMSKDEYKFEKARQLNKHITAIRADIARDFSHHFPQRRKLAVVIYLIDMLALRVGNEKEEHTADTVGCCTLKVQHVKLKEPTTLEFDFVGKDSIPFDKRIVVSREVFCSIQGFCEGKEDRDLIFDGIKPAHVNAHLEHYMHGLTAKVFRTYLASMLLDQRLQEPIPKGADFTGKMALYIKANTEVAMLLNHRKVRKVNKEAIAHLIQDIEKKKVTLAQLEAELAHGNDGERFEGEVLEIREEIERMEKRKEEEEDRFRLALETSRKSYLDPRITYAWCLRALISSDELFSEPLQKKFYWARHIPNNYRFEVLA